ncbi:ATP-binding protein [Pedobacter duraquae]|uniref:histidine kinase n=1 Tax=Pedobacter duraquae TaxID=425511 RepID=A0A4R6IEJ8_9SPHI|nr:ATP-binding protein [Pedobacter duraquae]TDO20723.1 PAS domain S-box-containing protein [Pedobacter duraquae]
MTEPILTNKHFFEKRDVQAEKSTSSAYPLLENEAERLKALQSYHILDTAEDADFDDLTALAAAICQTPIALISLVDQKRQWFKSHKGLSARETPRDYSFCAHGLAVPTQPLIVTDATRDVRFKENPLVTGDPGIVFYAGVPLVNTDGFALGSLCVIDTESRELSAEQIAGLSILGRQVIDKLELRRTLTNLAELNERLVESNHGLASAQLKLKQAIETGKMDTWSINPKTLEVTMSGFIKELFGYLPDEDLPMEAILEAVDPDYRQMLLDVLKDALENAKPSDTEYPITNKITGEQIWVKATGKVYFDSEGNQTEYSGMFMDITERKLDEIRKNDFIGMVSHELKTPLTSINGYIQLLQAKAKKSEDSFSQKALEKSAMQVKKMTAMINGFLNVSRLQSGKILLQKESFMMDQLVRNTVEDIIVSESNHNIILQPCSNLVVVGDADKIANVISNLVSNAIKYSPLGTTITVGCESVNDTVTVSVSDEGMGISETDLQHLFERYYRVESGNTALISGFGIGLYLCAEIVQIHSGKIWAESTIGEGSTFYFSIPLV